LQLNYVSLVSSYKRQELIRFVKATDNATKCLSKHSQGSSVDILLRNVFFTCYNLYIRFIDFSLILCIFSMKTIGAILFHFCDI